MLVDIRPLVERRGEMGFIPASLSLPLAQPILDHLSSVESLRHDAEALVFYCLTGRRSDAAVQTLKDHIDLPVYSLAGGFLAWEASGLPVCRFGTPPPNAPHDVLSFRRHLLACFVAENIEYSLEHDVPPIDPRIELERVFLEAGVLWDAPTVEGLFRVLDRTSLRMRKAGGDIRHISETLQTMCSMLLHIDPMGTDST